MEKYVMALFLGAGSVMDLRKREIPAVFLGGFAAAGILLQFWTMLAEKEMAGCAGWIAGGVAGILLMGIAKVTDQAIGYGDAWTAAVLGVWLGILPMMEIVFLGLFLAAGYSAWLFLVKRAGRKYRIAFLPFLMAGYLIWLFLAGEAG